jgi:F-type H+-transporting ATPase subunit a
MAALPLLKVDFNPVSEFTDFVHHPYVNLPLGLDINKAVVYMWMAALLATVLTLIVARRGLKVRPDGGQTAAEIVYDLCKEQIARGGLPEEGMRIWFPYVATLFVFIWMMNLIGFVPLPFGDRHFELFGVSFPEFQIYAATANLSVTLALTLVTFFATHIEGIRYNGVVKYFKSWMPSGLPSPRPFGAKTPAVLLLIGIIAVIEVLSQFIRIVSLSFRLFFNLLAGHLVIAVFLGLASLLGTYAILIVGIPMGIAVYLLECTLIAGLQAFIFATLSAIYIGGAIHPDH